MTGPQQPTADAAGARAGAIPRAITRARARDASRFFQCFIFFPSLFRPKGLHRLQAGGLHRGVQAEDDPQHHGEQEGADGDDLARQIDHLRSVFRQLFRWGGSIALVFTVLYAAGGRLALGWLTDNAEVVDTAAHYLVWVLLRPFVSVSAFLWDGIFIGATATRQMLMAMFSASLLFFLIYFGLAERLGNHALWLAFLVYLLSRGLVQWGLWRRLLRK